MTDEKSTPNASNTPRLDLEAEIAKHKKTLEAVQAQVNENANDLRKLIKKHPLLAVTVALSVGAFIGLLIGRCTGRSTGRGPQ